MSATKVLEIEGVRYVVRGLTFEELVNLGQNGVENKDSYTIVREIVHHCLVVPKLEFREISAFPDQLLAILAHSVMDLARMNLEEKGFRKLPDDKGPPPGMIT